MGANVIMVASGKGGTGKSTVAVLTGGRSLPRAAGVCLLGGAGFRPAQRGLYRGRIRQDCVRRGGRAERPLRSRQGRGGKPCCIRGLYVISRSVLRRTYPRRQRCACFVREGRPRCSTPLCWTLRRAWALPLRRRCGVAHLRAACITPDPVIHPRRTHCVRRAGGGRAARKYGLSSTRCRARWQSCGIQEPGRMHRHRGRTAHRGGAVQRRNCSKRARQASPLAPARNRRRASWRMAAPLRAAR